MWLTRGLRDISHRDFQGREQQHKLKTCHRRPQDQNLVSCLNRVKTSKGPEHHTEMHHDVLPDTHLRSRCAQSRVSTAAGAPGQGPAPIPEPGTLGQQAPSLPAELGADVTLPPHTH